jgi:hypothetical protein
LDDEGMHKANIFTLPFQLDQVLSEVSDGTSFIARPSVLLRELSAGLRLGFFVDGNVGLSHSEDHA